LTEAMILQWADAFHDERGSWPHAHSGPVPQAGGISWGALDFALTNGRRGLPGGRSLVRLLLEERGVPSKAHLPPLAVADILRWADAFHDEHGSWPHAHSGPVAQARDFTWMQVNRALMDGFHGLPGGSSLAILLALKRDHRHRSYLLHLTEQEILQWADAYHQVHSAWPTHHSGPVAEAPGESWSAINCSLTEGLRGLPGGSSLARLLEIHRGRRNQETLPPLSVEQILAWADAFQRHHSRWPAAHSGPVPDSNGETWGSIDGALRAGCRGFPGGSSLPRLLAQHRNKPLQKSRTLTKRKRPSLTVEQILAWARAHHERHGCAPGWKSGEVAEAPGETWNAIGHALARGRRGLPSGMTLGQLLKEAGLRGQSGE
jgi:hypothetical protein